MKTKDPYIKQIQAFLNMMQGRLSHAFDEQDNGNDSPMEKLYQQEFKIEFMGKKCELSFGASEFQAIETMLHELIEELKL